MSRLTIAIGLLLLTACSDDASSPGPAGATGDGGTTSSGGGGSSGSTPTASGSLGKKPGGFQFAGKDKTATADAMVGTHDVAIYRTPADKTSWIGLAKLTITRTGTELSAKLVAGDGSVVQEVTNDMENPRDYGQATVTPAIGKVLIAQIDAKPLTTIDFNANEDGSISGYVGGKLEYGFRNDILAFGPDVPAQLRALEGTWKGNHMAALCRAPVEASFASGKVTVKGTPQPGCAGEETVETTWNGNDDYVITTAFGNPQIFIDTLNGGGSNSTGGVRIDLNPDGTMKELRAFFSGFQGNLPKGDVASMDLKKQ